MDPVILSKTKLLSLIFLAALHVRGWSQDLQSSDFSVEDSPKRIDLLLGVEGSLFSTSISSLNGIGLNLGLQYHLNTRWSLGASANQAFDVSGFGALFSGFNTHALYHFKDIDLNEKRRVLQEQRPIIIERKLSDSYFSIGAGVEQLILNGTTSVYPAPGFSLLVTYNSRLFGANTVSGFRYGTYQVNSQSATAMFITLSYVLD